MKKIIALFLCFALVTGCSKNSSPEPDVTARELTETGAAPDETQAVTTTAATESTETYKPVLPLLAIDELPRIDGSTSAIPLVEALYALMTDIPREKAAELVNFSGTTESYYNVVKEYRDLLVSGAVKGMVKVEHGFSTDTVSTDSLQLAPICRDGLVFIVNQSNPVDSITTEQIQKIYTGEITNWKELGGENVAIEPFQRNASAGSQAWFLELVMKDIEPMKADVKYYAQGMSPLIAAIASFNGTGAAIGYSVYYYAQNINPGEGLKFLNVDGVQPTRDTIRDGSYPHISDYYAGIRKAAPSDSVEREIFNWIQSDEGKTLIEHEGYVAVD